MEELSGILSVISTVRIRKVMEEQEIQDAIERAFREQDIPYEREAKVAPRCRLDFLSSGVAVEVKKRRPEKAKLIAQITRYAKLDAIRAVIVVLERSIDLPSNICGKPVRVLSLNSLWGVAL